MTHQRHLIVNLLFVCFVPLLALPDDIHHDITMPFRYCPIVYQLVFCIW